MDQKQTLRKLLPKRGYALLISEKLSGQHKLSTIRRVIREESGDMEILNAAFEVIEDEKRKAEMVKQKIRQYAQ